MALKDEILKALEEAHGVSISGEELAEQLHLSRTAVWKAVSQLRQDGHHITAVQNKGYCLSADSDVLSPQGIMAYLQDNTLCGQLVVLDTVDSTSLEAKRFALEGAADKTIVLANQQTAGRGRMGRSFFSPKGMGLYMSLILRPKLTGDRALLITTAVSVAVTRAIERLTAIPCKIKWVNDVFMGDKKICGILTEAITDFESGSIDCVVIGIGINFCGKKEDIPIELREIIGYLFTEKPQTLSRNQLAAEVITEVLAITENLQADDFIEEYREKSLILQQEIEIIKGEERQSATAIDIDDKGGLVVETAAGERLTISSGEVSIRRKKQ